MVTFQDYNRQFATDGRGGGNALPPYLQGRTSALTRPMVPPTSSVVPGENRRMFGSVFRRLGQFGQQAQPQGGIFRPSVITPRQPPVAGAPPVAGTPGAGQPPQPAGQPAAAQTLYEFFKGDLERERDRALANARTDAAARGVFYGTPLTTSQGDIQTEFGRGLGQLQAGILQNEQGNELQRLALASSLLGSLPQARSGGIDPEVFRLIGSLFAPRQGPTSPAMAPAQQQPPLRYQDVRR